jgi:hypothetical protein
MVDYYALLPSNNWNIVSYNGQMPDSSIKNTMQWNLDWGALQHYRKLRKETQNPRKKLYVVPPTFGRWDPTNSKWKVFQYPTPKWQGACSSYHYVMEWMECSTTIFTTPIIGIRLLLPIRSNGQMTPMGLLMTQVDMLKINILC